MHWSRLRSTDKTLLGLLFLAVAVASLQVILRYHQQAGNHDYLHHVYFVQLLDFGGRYPPHLLFHLLLDGLTGLTRDKPLLLTASIAVCTLAHVARMGLGMAWLARDLEGPAALPKLALAGLTLALVAPIPNWWGFPAGIYSGQFSATAWHNPTVLLTIPFCLAAVWQLLSAPGWRGDLWTAVWITLATLAKPNFSLALIPAAGLLTLGRTVSWRRLAALATPTVLILGWMFSRAYGQEAETSHLVLRPMAVWKLALKGPAWAALILSYGFPLAVTALTWKRWRDPRLFGLAWLTAGIAITQFLLLAEDGPRLHHGNFFWGTVPATLLLFLASLKEWMAVSPRTAKPRQRATWWTAAVLLALHLLGGALFYVNNLKGMGWEG